MCNDVTWQQKEGVKECKSVRASVRMFMHVHICVTGGQNTMLSIFLDYSPHCCRVRVSQGPDLALLSDQLNPEDPLDSTGPQH